MAVFLGDVDQLHLFPSSPMLQLKLTCNLLDNTVYNILPSCCNLRTLASLHFDYYMRGNVVSCYSTLQPSLEHLHFD